MGRRVAGVRRRPTTIDGDEPGIWWWPGSSSAGRSASDHARERIDAEEALLAAEFGDAWADYRRRSWRLVPWL
jgi:hypothetical protein